MIGRMRIGVDLGGTKIEGVVLDNNGVERARIRIATPPAYAESLTAIATLVTDLEHRAGCRATVGIGIPGAVTPSTGRVKNANSVWLIGQPLVADLSHLLQREIRVRNDADCFALSEATDGAGAGAATVFGVILGTGVGGGLVVHGHGVQGPNLIAGEWGHNPLPWPTAEEAEGPPCYCGKSGCIETWLSGPGLAREFLANTGRDWPTQRIVSEALQTEPLATAALHRYQHRLAKALATVINVLDPEVIVLGGGMSNIPNLSESVTAELPHWVFSDEVHTRVVRNCHGDSSGVRGAAWLWPPAAV
jgi:fructokinase